jgi:hypothetical protein
VLLDVVVAASSPLGVAVELVADEEEEQLLVDALLMCVPFNNELDPRAWASSATRKASDSIISCL